MTTPKVDKQVRAIVAMLAEGEPVHNSGGKYVTVGGKQFLRKHLNDALGIYHIMRRNQQAHKIETLKQQTPMQRLRRFVEGIFLGKK